MNSVEFNRIEDCIYYNREVIVSFDTRQNGIYQLSHLGEKHKTLKNEPNLPVFTKEEQQFMKEIAALCWKIVFDGRKPDFDSLKA